MSGCESKYATPKAFFPIKEYGKWGYINTNGEVVIKCQFENAGHFSEGLAAVCIDTLWGLLTRPAK